MRDSLKYYGVANVYTGHGRVSRELVAQFVARKMQLKWFPLYADEPENNRIPNEIRAMFVEKQSGPGLVWTNYSHRTETAWSGSLRYVVHETSQYPRDAVRDYNNNCCALATPSDWGAKALRKSGVKQPVYVVPHGVSVLFKYAAPVFEPCKVFGFAGRVGCSAGLRKNPNSIVNAFQSAFPHTHDGSVRLEIKSFPDVYDINTHGDPRIKVIREFWTEQQFAQWLKTIYVYVNLSGGEGWSMPTHEALATGRPVISTYHGGPTQYLTPECSYLIPHKLRTQHRGFYAGQQLAEPDHDIVVDTLRYCANNPQDVIARGLAGTMRAHQFSWNTAATLMIKALKQEGII